MKLIKDNEMKAKRPPIEQGIKKLLWAQAEPNEIKHVVSSDGTKLRKRSPI